MNALVTEQVESIAQEPTESKKWANSVDEFLGTSGVKPKPKSMHLQHKVDEWKESIQRRKNIIDALETFHENGGFELVAHEIEIQEQFRGTVSSEEIGRIIRGHIFENLAVHLLSQEGKPINPEASQKFANIIRFPHKFIDEVEETFKKKGIPIEKEVAQNLEAAKAQIKRHPRNNDAIAFDVRDDEGVRTAKITGSYEMKNYLLGSTSKAESVRKQLEDAAEDTREVIRILNETKLYTAYASIMDLPELPHIISIVDEEEFEQIVVQPQGMFQTDDKEDAKNKRKAYERDFNKGVRSKYGFSYVGVSNRELTMIYEKADADIRKYLKERN